MRLCLQQRPRHWPGERTECCQRQCWHCLVPRLARHRHLLDSHLPGEGAKHRTRARRQPGPCLCGLCRHEQRGGPRLPLKPGRHREEGWGGAAGRQTGDSGSETVREPTQPAAQGEEPCSRGGQGDSGPGEGGGLGPREGRLGTWQSVWSWTSATRGRKKLFPWFDRTRRPLLPGLGAEGGVRTGVSAAGPAVRLSRHALLRGGGFSAHARSSHEEAAHGSGAALSRSLPVTQPLLGDGTWPGRADQIKVTEARGVRGRKQGHNGRIAGAW